MMWISFSLSLNLFTIPHPLRIDLWIVMNALPSSGVYILHTELVRPGHRANSQISLEVMAVYVMLAWSFPVVIHGIIRWQSNRIPSKSRIGIDRVTGKTKPIRNSSSFRSTLGNKAIKDLMECPELESQQAGRYPQIVESIRVSMPFTALSPLEAESFGK